MYLNKNEAELDISDIVKDYTDDYSISIVKKKVIDSKIVEYFFVLTVLKFEENDLFKKLMKANLIQPNLQLVESSYHQDNRAMKELFLIKCKINIFGV